MASSVFYKFSSRKDESRVTFDGTGISVFDLKRDIILANNMGKANDFDLAIYDATSKQGICLSSYSQPLVLTLCPELKDDSQIIPRSSSVVVKRLPAARPGKGKASMYVAGVGNAIPTSEPVQRHGASNGPTSWHKGAMSKRFDVKEDPSSKTTVSSI
jgi:protein MPE1